MADFRTLFVTGQAGTGKTYLVRKNIEKDHSKAVLCATTGIAAVNLSQGGNVGDVVTINSLLKYFDEASLYESFAKGTLQKTLKGISRLYRAIAVDEASMLTSGSLDLIYDALVDINNLVEVQNRGGLGLWLVGDFLQLPPIKGKFAFYARCWKENFGKEVKRLTKVYRQTNPDFLAALNYARGGDGDHTASSLVDCGAKFTNSLNYMAFEGTTIVATNNEANDINGARLIKLIDSGEAKLTFPSQRWGTQRPEWKLIPDELVLTVNSYAMILSNDTPAFTYANGDCGTVVGGDIGKGIIDLQLARNGGMVVVKRVGRKVYSSETPIGMSEPEYKSKTQYKEYLKQLGESQDNFDFKYDTYLVLKTIEDRKKAANSPYYDYERDKWVIGGIMYMPLRLAYASTTHKTQGLTLDRVQIDIKNKFFGHPAMSYVALSRVRNAEGLTIGGSPALLASRTNVSSEVLDWI